MAAIPPEATCTTHSALLEAHTRHGCAVRRFRGARLVTLNGEKLAVFADAQLHELASTGTLSSTLLRQACDGAWCSRAEHVCYYSDGGGASFAFSVPAELQKPPPRMAPLRARSGDWIRLVQPHGFAYLGDKDEVEEVRLRRTGVGDDMLQPPSSLDDDDSCMLYAAVRLKGAREWLCCDLASVSASASGARALLAHVSVAPGALAALPNLLEGLHYRAHRGSFGLVDHYELAASARAMCAGAGDMDAVVYVREALTHDAFRGHGHVLLLARSGNLAVKPSSTMQTATNKRKRPSSLSGTWMTQPPSQLPFPAPSTLLQQRGTEAPSASSRGGGSAVGPATPASALGAEVAPGAPAARK